MRITNCKVNHLINPLGFHMEKAVFSWQVEETEGKKQTKARILVCCSEKVVADSGWGEFDSLATTVDMELLPCTRYTWTVTVCTDADEETTSDENWFETGKMEMPWSGKWIGSNGCGTRHPVFSKQIELTGELKAARLYTCGLGLYEAYFNGEKIGDEFLAPYCNNYNEWVQYQTYDVTKQMSQSGMLSVMLGNGWYNGRFGFDDRTGQPYYGEGLKLIAELHLIYADGREEVLGTDRSWKVTYSNVIFSNIYDGEQVDDTLDAAVTENACLVEPPRGRLTERRSLPVKIQEVLPATELLYTPAGETVVDLGQNIAGTFRLRVCEPAGTRIHIQVGEVLQQGNFYRDNLRTAKAEYIYVSDGKEHVLQPHFTYYGYRYAKIEGISELKKEAFEGLVMYSDMPRTGWLKSDNELVNKLILNTEWGQKGNFLDVPTDCPQRDERMGWTGDAEVFSPTACYLRDSHAFFAKYLYDMATEQKGLDGAVPDVVPSFGRHSISSVWGDAACIIPWNLYQFYGDKTILEEQFDSMKGWVDYISALEEKDHGWSRHFHYGDWLALDGSDGIDGMKGATEDAFIALTYLRYSSQLVAKAAAVLEKRDEEERYDSLADKILEEIRHEYFSPSGRCCIDTQTALLLSLRHGLAMDTDKTASQLKKKMKDCGGKLQTGFVGTPILCEELTKAGMSEMAFELLFNEEYPGWLYEVKLGATTIWERWNSMLADGSVSSTGMNSFNHYSYGSVVEWIYAYVAGIRQTLDSVGFRHVIINPIVDIRLGSMEARYCSAMGQWKTSWKVLDDYHLEIGVTVPFGCKADLVLPYAPNLLFEDSSNTMFADVRNGVCYLDAGEYSVVYETTCPLRKIYSTYMPVGELLDIPSVRAFLTKTMPQIVQLPDSMRGGSIREIAKQSGGHFKPELLDQLDMALSKIM